MNAEESVLITFHKLSGEIATMICPTLPFIHFFEDTDKKTSCMMLPIELDDERFLEGEQLAGVYIDVTNDPTPHRAGGVVSLGYYCLRFTYKFCKITSTAPLTLEGYGGDDKTAIIESHFTRPLRRVTP